MANKTPEQIAAKFQRRVAAAGQDYLDGVQNPSKDWATATAAAQSRWANGVQEAIQSNRFQRGVQAAGSPKWQEAASSIGAQRYTAAANIAAQRFAQRAGQVMAAAGAAREAAGRLSNTTYEQRKQRALAAIDAIHNYWKGRKGA